MSQAEVATTDRFSIRKEQQGCYVFSKEQLVALFGTIQKALGKKPEVTLELSNQRSITSEDIDQILNDPFIESSAISSLTYSVYGFDAPNKITIRLRDTWLSPISYEISGDRNFCLGLEQSITSVFSGAKKWYGMLNIHNHNGIIQMLIVFPLSALIAFLAYLPFYKREPTTYPLVFFLMFSLMVFVIPYGTVKIIPKMVFNMGRGRIVHERMLRPITWTTSAVFLGLLATYFREQIATFIGSVF